MSIIGDASNIRVGDNPAYSLSDFQGVYPQFTEVVIPPTVVDMYISLANNCIKEARWHDYWKMAMGLFIAHFCTIYIQGTSDPASGAGAVLAAGQAKGLVTSKSVDGVSVSYDFSEITKDLDGWATWKLTIFGLQLASIGRLVGKGNMYIW